MRILHVMLRVNDLNESIEFYSNLLGMNVLRTDENVDYRYTLAFLGYGGTKEGSVELELTYNWDTSDYDHGNAYGHIAIEVEDVFEFCKRVHKLGGNVSREPGPVKGGKTVIAFIEDPNGYKIELISKADAYEGLGG